MFISSEQLPTKRQKPSKRDAGRNFVQASCRRATTDHTTTTTATTLPLPLHYHYHYHYTTTTTTTTTATATATATTTTTTTTITTTTTTTIVLVRTFTSMANQTMLGGLFPNVKRTRQAALLGDIGLEYCTTDTSRQAPPCASMPHHTTLKVCRNLAYCQPRFAKPPI